ncbi:GAF domain-containing sensor histidine kinase [Pigmentiphaga aceris]|uniref:histidine kinase n=1 Tax=Pigmentiphaga aceris TaxID=1940612 RepID=A0A5C0ATT5_9BURK|nr:GAF domain-containing sensor histidine kinase [Pigmentiphaga aceris]QEI05698.1 GAF domain-containing sensor histidine kinase [Pigmentiphaga aceris]
MSGRTFDDDIAAISRIDSVEKILQVVCNTTGMGFAAVARVTAERWVVCAVRDQIEFGLWKGSELKIETTICNEIRGSRQAVVIDHVDEDPVFSRHPTPAMYGFQSYISMPIFRENGEFFGTLCAIDPKPMALKSSATVEMFEIFAQLIGFHLDAQERLASSEAALLDARQSSVLREQFIAVLGHDLRNPLGSINAGAEVLRRSVLDTRATAMVTLIQKSVGRMAVLIDNVLDFARGRLGGGLTLERNANKPLEAELTHVIAELQSIWPDQVINADLSIMTMVDCDRGRVGQLLSNLLANAISHGAPGRPVQVEASDSGGFFVLSVINQGAPIPAKTLDSLFLPFFRAASSPSHQGLGLGLYIATEIARAHGGTLDVVSTTRETRFTFRMPLREVRPALARR